MTYPGSLGVARRTRARNEGKIQRVVFVKMHLQAENKKRT
jgi:hypothetical protein